MTKKIMIADDSLVIRRQISAILAQAGYDVIEATNGEDALGKLDAQRDVALVLCDVNMPVLGGFEMLSALNARLGAARCQVVMLTSEAHPTLVARAKELGAAGWMVKPVAASGLLATLEKLGV